jgi:hypothetical protein
MQSKRTPLLGVGGRSSQVQLRSSRPGGLGCSSSEIHRLRNLGLAFTRLPAMSRSPQSEVSRSGVLLAPFGGEWTRLLQTRAMISSADGRHRPKRRTRPAEDWWKDGRPKLGQAVSEARVRCPVGSRPTDARATSPLGPGGRNRSRCRSSTQDENERVFSPPQIATPSGDAAGRRRSGEPPSGRALGPLSL